MGIERRGFIGRIGAAIGLMSVGVKANAKPIPKPAVNTLITQSAMLKFFSEVFYRDIHSHRIKTKLGRKAARNYKVWHVLIPDVPLSMDWNKAKLMIGPAALELAKVVTDGRVRTLERQEIPRSLEYESCQLVSEELGIAVRCIRMYRIHYDDYVLRFDIRGRA